MGMKRQRRSAPHLHQHIFPSNTYMYVDIILPMQCLCKEMNMHLLGYNKQMYCENNRFKFVNCIFVCIYVFVMSRWPFIANKL